ncbi:MAG TPA: transcription antitermination factor NusB, partial [Candidatus Dormibacteraeota bacterium]|nr:transcription antitermination factor NusB [Candidatus Dormibacteraeota bacterium]
MTPGAGGGRRRRGRELALRVLFELEGSDKDAEESLAYQGAEVGATADVLAFARRLVLACLENRERIDAALSTASRWSLG